MVYMSGSKASRNESSITARCQGGGDKLAGIAPRVGKSAILTPTLNRTSNSTVSHKAFVLLGEVCRNAGCGCDKAINSFMCQGNASCRSMFPYNQRPTGSGVHGRRWA